jgi:hypothetical protein
MKPFHVRKREEEEEKRLRQDAESEHGYELDKDGHLTHHTSGQKTVRAPDPHPWLSGRAEERVEQEQEKKEQKIKDAAFEHGYAYINGHYVPLEDNGYTKKTLKPLPRQQPPSSGSLSSKPLSSSTYMVCTQAGNNALVPLPTFVEKLQLLETRVATLEQKIRDIDTMRDEIKNMGYKLTQSQNILQFLHDQIQPRKVFQMRRLTDLQDDTVAGGQEYAKA